MAASLIAISTMVAVVPTTYAMESEDSQPQTTDTATVQTTKAAGTSRAKTAPRTARLPIRPASTT